MNEYEISKLKKQLQRKNEIIVELKNDLSFAQKQLVTAQAQRDKYHGQLQIARQTTQNIDKNIQDKVKNMKNKLEIQNATALSQLQSLRNQLKQEKNLSQKHSQEIRNKDAVISQLSLRLRQMSIKHKDSSLQINVRQLSQQASITYNQFYKLTQKYNRLSQNMQNILAQNKILRKLHGVPDNFGFDLQQIKIAQKQQLQDYKAQCRKLQTQIQQLQAQRTQLRYRLRQYNTLYSNKGQRYKDMTQRQLQLLDAYALNLKDGNNQLPQIDKTQKQMQRQIIRLRAQIQILQSKNPIMMLSNKEQQGGSQLNKQALKKIELQIKSTLQPFVKDFKKLSDTNVISLVQNIQNSQHHYQQENSHLNPNVVSNVAGSRPPIPLPIANNDWSTIKDGYSYRYACKIPIDLKDYHDDINTYNIIKSKYQLAALQLQNIQSLKLLTQKQKKQHYYHTQLANLKQKYQKCLLIQDSLFIKYFQIKQLYKNHQKSYDLQKRKVIDQRDQLRSELSVLKQTLHTLSTKTEIQIKNKDFGIRLAKSQACLLKQQRKYQIILAQHQSLRDSYTKMQLKSAQSQTHLKTKYLNARQNQKQLTMLMNLVLHQTKDSVSSDTYNLLLSKMELLNDKQAQSAFKQADLRIKISRLESVQRQMNIKDEVIQHLRQQKLDILLQLQILKNRLKTIDPSYRRAFTILQNLVKFINQNTLSILQCFKKFDRDNSGTLTKSQFKSALDLFGFNLSNNQFDLLFNQFDLDGSGTLTYSQFMRKLKRSGAISRGQSQNAIYLFFKAIKQANISIKKAFQIVDADNSGSISKSQMQTAFRQIGIQCSTKTINSIFKMINGDINTTITCPQLQKLYFQIIKQTQLDDYQLKPTLDWKYKFMLKLQQASIKNKITIEQAFKILDDDGNSYMTIDQLSTFLNKLGVKLQYRYLEELFKFLDYRIDGKVQYGQFLKLLDQAKRQQRKVQRLISVQKRAEQLKKQHEVIPIRQTQQQSKHTNQQAIYKIKLMSLQTKQSNLLKKNQKLCKSLANKQQQIKDLQKTIQQNDNQLSQLQDKYTKQKQLNIKKQQKNQSVIDQSQFKNIINQKKIIQIQNLELITQLETFKGLYNTLSNQNKMKLIGIEKIKAQLNKHYDIVKQLQTQDVNKAQLGRLSLQLQYSKRNQQIVNKKYEDICQQTKVIAQQNYSLKNESLQKQKQIVNTYLLMKQKTNLLQRNIQVLTSKAPPTITLSKFDELTNKLRQISSLKSQLQQQNKTLRQKNFNLQIKNDYIQIQKSSLNQLQKKLRNNFNDDHSISLINLNKQLNQCKMSELKTRRQYNLLKQKQQYYLRVNNTNSDNLKQLQSQIVKWQSKFNDRQQFWKKRMADQLKLTQQIKKQVQKTKSNQIKAIKYFKQKQFQDNKLQDQYNSLSHQRQQKISKFISPSTFHPSPPNNQRLQSLQNQINELTFELQQKQRQISQLRLVVPPQKSNFVTIGHQTNPYQSRSYNLQTDLTSNQLKSNARKFINSQKQQQIYYKQQAQKITQAAQHSIDTLQKIIDDKNQQIKRKDKIIDQLKKQIIKMKQQNCYQIQKLYQQIKQLKSKNQFNNVNQIMNRSTQKGFYQSGNDQRANSLINMIDQKDQQIKNLQKKCYQLQLSTHLSSLEKFKGNSVDQPNNKQIESKLKQLNQQRQTQKSRYVQIQNRMKKKVQDLQKVIKDKDLKLTKLHKTIIDLKQEVINQKDNLNQSPVKGNQEFIMNMNKGNTANDSKMEIMLQRAMDTIQTMTKKNKQYESQIKRLRGQSKLNRTVSRK